MKYSWILAFFMMVFPLGVDAQKVDIIVTKDGNRYEGYLAKQIPNKSITIVSSKTTMMVASKDAETSNIRKKQIADLSEEYGTLFPLLSEDAVIELADIAVEGLDGRKMTFHRAVILESGENLKFVCFEPKTIDFDWSQLKLSCKTPYDFGKPQSFCDRLILPDARILEGQMMEQDLRSGIIKFREKDGQVTSFHKNKVQAIRFFMEDSKADIWESIPYCDRINLKNGNSVDGFIVSKVFGQTVEIQHFNSSILETIRIGEVESYEKYKNPLFRLRQEEPESIEPAAELYVNGDARHVCELQKGRRSYSVTNEIDSLRIRVNVGASVVVKYRTGTENSHLQIAKARLAKDRIIRLRGLIIRNRETEFRPVFSESDYLINPDINFQANEEGYIVADFVLDSPGAYVFFVKGSKRCFVIYAQ